MFLFKEDKKNIIENKWIIFLSFFALGLLGYFYALNGDFIGDDIGRILENAELNSLKTALSGELRDRPLLMFSVWLDKTLFGLSPFFMRLENLVFHAGVGTQLYLLINEFLKNLKKVIPPEFIFLLCALFIVHPLHNQTITMVIQRGVLFSSFAALISIRHFLKYLNELSLQSLYLSCLFLILGMLSKQNIIFIPFFYLFILFGVYRKSKINFNWTVGGIMAPLIIPVFFYFISGANIQKAEMTISPLSYFLVQTQVLFVYLKLMILPVGLKFSYDFYPPTHIFPNVFWIYFSIHVFLFSFIYKALKESWARLWFISIYLAFLPETGFFPIMHLAFEHRTYIPMLFIFIFLSVLFSSLDEQKQKKICTFFPIIIILFLGLNQLRNREIKNINEWKLHTLEHSVSGHAINFKFSTDLMAAGYSKQLKNIITKYDELYPDIAIYRILDEIYQYYIGDKSNIHIANAALLLANTELPSNQRVYINAFFLKMLGGPEVSLEEHLVLEDLLSRQHKIFFQNKEQYKIYTGYYQSETPTLVLALDNNLQLKAKYYFQYLKMRAILKYYYAKPDGELKELITLELKKDPSNKTLIRLREMAE